VPAELSLSQRQVEIDAGCSHNDKNCRKSGGRKGDIGPILDPDRAEHAKPLILLARPTGGADHTHILLIFLTK
jgi:hypothetical protein